MLTKRATTKDTLKEEVKRVWHPAYVRSAEFLGYDDDIMRRLTLEAPHQGSHRFKTKVGSNDSTSRISAAGRSSTPSLTTTLTCLREGNPRATAASKERTRGQRGMRL